MMPARAILAALWIAVATSSCGSDVGPGAEHAAVVRAAAGASAQETFEALDALLARAADGADPRLVRDHALAALHASAFAAAESSAHRIAHGADASLAADGWFVLGAVALARADLAHAQATGPEAEPFAFDAAIALAGRARDAFVRAVLTAERWDAAVRNAERARRRVLVWSAERDGREPPAAQALADGAPDVQLVPDGDAGGGGGESDSDAAPGANELGLDDLTDAELERLLERLADDERQRLEARAARRAERSKDVERDW